MGYAPVHAPPFAPKPKNHPTPKKDNPSKDTICHQCGEVGHWRRNCPIYLTELMKKKKLSQGASTSGDLSEPANYKAALLDPESDKWLNAMNVEMQSMKDNEVWKLVDLPPNGKTVGHKWLLKKKTDIDGAGSYKSHYSIYDNGMIWMSKLPSSMDISMKRSKRLIGLCQSAYINKVLKRFYMENSKRGTIPMQEKLKLSKSQGASTPAEIQRMQNISYASAVGSIMYVVRLYRPDVAFSSA
ncbi:retrotransposon protein, putative, ty1-copia subclass [Tanacetum coccineum]